MQEDIIIHQSLTDSEISDNNKNNDPIQEMQVIKSCILFLQSLQPHVSAIIDIIKRITIESQPCSQDVVNLNNQSQSQDSSNNSDYNLNVHLNPTKSTSKQISFDRDGVVWMYLLQLIGLAGSNQSIAASICCQIMQQLSFEQSTTVPNITTYHKLLPVKFSVLFDSFLKMYPSFARYRA